MTDPCVMDTVQIDASPDEVYRLITDLPTLASLAEEAVAMEWRKGSAVQPGAVFTGHNQSASRRWSTRCTVTDAEPGRRFAFDVRHTVLPIARWQYDLAAADGGCRVTESAWDRRLDREPMTPYSCRQGFCGTCKVKVLAGQVDHRGRSALVDDEMLVCVSRANGHRVVIDV